MIGNSEADLLLFSFAGVKSLIWCDDFNITIIRLPNTISLVTFFRLGATIYLCDIFVPFHIVNVPQHHSIGVVLGKFLIEKVECRDGEEPRHNVHPPDSRRRVGIGEYAIPDRFDVRVGAVALLVVYYHSALVYVCQLRCDAWAGMPIATKTTAVSAFVQPFIRPWPDAYNVAKVQKYSLSFVGNGWKIVLTIRVSGVVRYSLSTDTPFFFRQFPLTTAPFCCIFAA